ncbi:hypothetical protein G7Y79_00066g095210 [Physcia stellaris]|nr:hypothetical protein G7Y79_00066g095210 [Physcia stellaris]
MTEVHIDASSPENQSQDVGLQRGLLDQFILFGDSITQQASSQELGFAFQPALQNAFIRRLDVINRGFSGYNTSQCLAVLPSFMPNPSQAHVRFLMVFLGANDSVFPNTSGQDVPLDRYRANLRNIIQHHKLQAHATNNHGKPATKIILVTPPPIDEYQLQGFPLLDIRTAERTKSYADACVEVGEELGVAVIHLWEIMMKKAGWEGKEGEVLVGSKKREKSQALEEMLVDGLHFKPPAYKVLFEATMELIRDKWPSEDPLVENYSYVVPVWQDAPWAE